MEHNLQKQNFSAIILAAGDSSKFGKDKAMLELYGETLLEITYYRIRNLFDKIFIVVGSYAKKSQYSNMIAEDILIDTRKNKGSLGGLLTGLKACKTRHAFLLGCDMPMINKDVVKLILSKTGYNAVVPKHENGKLEPLHALYKVKPSIKAVESSLNDEKFSFRDVFMNLGNVCYVSTEEIMKIDPQLQSFFNIESEVDYLLAKEKLKKREFSSRLAKAKRLEAGIEKETETSSTIYYKVPGTEEDHEVIYSKRKNSWKCDCKHFSVKGTYCSHILAVKTKGEK